MIAGDCLDCKSEHKPQQGKRRYAEQKISVRVFYRLQKLGILRFLCVSKNSLRYLVSAEIACDGKKKPDEDQQKAQS